MAKYGFNDASNAYTKNGDNFISFQYVFGGQKQYVRFKAFITEYKDDFAVSWNSEQVYGRNDPIMTYRNTVRTINVGWEVPAASSHEAIRNMARAAQLMRFCYPAYEDSGNANTISKPPLLRVKFKNFMNNSGQGLLVAIQGFSFVPVMDNGFFDPSGPGYDFGEPPLVPKTLVFNCTMTVLHEKDIGWNLSSGPGDVANWSGDAKLFPFLPEGSSVQMLEDKNPLEFAYERPKFLSKMPAGLSEGADVTDHFAGINRQPQDLTNGDGTKEMSEEAKADAKTKSSGQQKRANRRERKHNAAAHQYRTERYRTLREFHNQVDQGTYTYADKAEWLASDDDYQKAKKKHDRFHKHDE